MLKEKYFNEVKDGLQEEFGLKNVNDIPKLVKIVVNMGVGKATENSKLVDAAVLTLETITGQKPVVNKAKLAISNFKLREEVKIGTSVTLRGENMWCFLERVIVSALPRVRDFRGISKNKFDGRGNFNFGIKEQIIFPEINYDKVDTILGMDIAIVTTAKTDDESFALLSRLGFPFKK